MEYVMWKGKLEESYLLPFEGNHKYVPMSMSPEQAYRILEWRAFKQRMNDKMWNFIFKYDWQLPVVFWIIVVGGLIWFAYF